MTDKNTSAERLLEACGRTRSDARTAMQMAELPNSEFEQLLKSTRVPTVDEMVRALFVDAKTATTKNTTP